MTEAPTHDDHSNQPASLSKSCGVMFSSSTFDAVLWWVMLLVAIFAVPSIAFIITFATPLPDAMQIFVFMITCWLSTWIGMWLMRKAQ